ncbi:hypothetical protein CKN86_01305 [Carnobacterium divergens]|uniref:nucleotidyltransferase family protein n=1 Tax=Carnobacterium divergens TaxID=2748 RepID=UPI000D43E6D8|nr:nucleotidyltransferase family protein [Carnobacterium divergens]MCO6018457.1 nucleotidyltransferase family protein [Carnobacterium divergens]MPQ22144.1 hypothetical protein [Carnobacterium divergens]TFI65219.1 hypothetical protein CKN62_01305 [Carnobacterium divergens]TFI92109.1 hypothetical protein CKN84_01305 [Carnobacterium divergens]TFJ07332.1 hypothetical protein CKN86_01305 [Carnobacterium divergens]
MKKIFELSDVYLTEKIKITSKDNTEQLLGMIIMNRITNIAFKNIDLSEVEFEAFKNLEILSASNKRQARIFKRNLRYVTKLLKDVQCNYAFLKGAYMTTSLYDLGERNSNDIDILVAAEDVVCIQDKLLKHGFIQGKYDRERKKIVPASRERIIRQRMNYGQTVPLVKIHEDQPLEIDLNTSVDFKPELKKEVVKDLLSQKISISIEDYYLNTLNLEDFLIHLCCHLYKEATTYDWVKRRKDLCLYKFSDINVFLNNYSNTDYFNRLEARIKELELEKECYYVFENSTIVYPRLNNLSGFGYFKQQLKPDSLDFMNRVIYPREKKIFEYRTKDFSKRFLLNNRLEDLEEIT